MNQLAIVYLFQFLIGNTDWSIPAGHNINMIKSKKPVDQLPYVIPYDFDFAGIVNAHFAVPDKTLPIESVRERLYRGFCLDDGVIEGAVEQFIQAKEEILNLYENEDKLDKITRQNTIEYVAEFYRIIKNESRLKLEILENCR